MDAIGTAIVTCLVAVWLAWVAFCSFFSSPPSRPVDLTNAMRLLDVTDRTELVAQARNKLGIDVIDHFNFAFVGASGVGKSSLINALRHTSDNGPDAAAVGETETTTDVRRFPHPQYPHLVFWDFPGCGTQSVRADTYFEDSMLYGFDGIFLLSSDRFLKADYDIAEKAKEYGVMCAFVRTKSDAALISKARRGMSMIEASKVLRQEVQENVKKRLGNLWDSLQSKLFFVSSPAFEDASEYVYKNDRSLLEVGMDEAKIIRFMLESAKPRRQGSVC